MLLRADARDPSWLSLRLGAGAVGTLPRRITVCDHGYGHQGGEHQGSKQQAKHFFHDRNSFSYGSDRANVLWDAGVEMRQPQLVLISGN